MPLRLQHRLYSFRLLRELVLFPVLSSMYAAPGAMVEKVDSSLPLK